MGTIKKIEQQDEHAPDADAIGEGATDTPTGEAGAGSSVRRVTEGDGDAARREKARRVVKIGLVAALVVVVVIVIAIARACSAGPRNTSATTSGTATTTSAAETASGTNTSQRTDKNGYDSSIKRNVTVAGITFKVPSYFAKSNSYTDAAPSYQAEETDSGGGASLWFRTADSAGVTTESFYANAQKLVNAYVESVKSFTFDEVSEPTKREVANRPGIEAHVKTKATKGVSIDGTVIFVLNERVGQVIQVLFAQSDDTDYDYASDFKKIVESAKVAQQQNAQETTTTKSEEQKEPEATTEQPQPAPEAPAAGVTPSVKEALDSYEAFIDEYVAFMQTYSSSDNQTAMMMDYLSYLSKYGDLAKKIDAMDDSGMTDADLAYYTEVTLRCSQKLLNASL